MANLGKIILKLVFCYTGPGNFLKIAYNTSISYRKFNKSVGLYEHETHFELRKKITFMGIFVPKGP